MDEKRCGDCAYYRWNEDTFDDGTYIETEYCDDDMGRDCDRNRLACKWFTPMVKDA